MPEDTAPDGARGGGGPRGWLGALDRSIDEELNRFFSPTDRSRTGEAVDRYTQRVEDSLQRATGYAKRTKTSLDSMGDDAVGRLFGGGRRRKRRDEANIGWITRNPKKVFLAVALIALTTATPAVYIVGSPALGVESSMRGDFEVFLSPTDETTTILEEVRQDFSTDAMFIYGEMLDANMNITALPVLRALSAIEGDDDHPSPPTPDPEQGYRKDTNWSAYGIDPWRDDKGGSDGVVAVLSIPAIVKTANQTAGRLIEQLPGNYSIPNDQSLINRMVGGLPEDEVAALVADADDDGIYDHFAIIVLLHRDPKIQVQVMAATEDLLKDVNKQWEGTMKLYLTGPTPVIEAMQKRTIKEFIFVMPLVLAGLCVSLFVFHRTLKVIPIALVPVTLGLLMSLGIVGALHGYVIITPQVVIVAPVLLSLGVSYGLYISNRFGEEKGEDREKRLARAVSAINPAIMLSALTTAIGFASLMIGTLPPILTMGLGLTIGIVFTYIMVYILVPALIMMLKYEKRAATKAMKGFATVPSRNRKKIILFAVVAAILSVSLIPFVRFDADYLNMAPKDEPSVVKMQEYSQNMGGGQLGMVLIRRDPYVFETLDAMDRMGAELAMVPDTQSMSIITIMDAIAVPPEITVLGRTYPIPAAAQGSLWDTIVFLEGSSLPGARTASQQLIDTFYDALPYELREMLVSTESRRALIYCFQPFMDIDRTRLAVDGVNEKVAEFNQMYGEDFSTKLTGIAAITLAVNDLIIVSQINSLAVCIFLTFLVLGIVFRSLRVGLLTIIPVLCVIALEPGTLVGLDIPLSTITVMIGSIAIGTGIDFGIQISQRVRLGRFKLQAVFNAVENAGTSFVEATTTMLVGFAMVWFIPIDSIREFVVMIMALLFYNAAFALIVLPAVYTIVIRFREARMRRKGKGPPVRRVAKAAAKSWLTGWGVEEETPEGPDATAEGAPVGDASGAPEGELPPEDA